jgi:hypothetical protein
VSHRAACTFGPGFYRLVLVDGSRHFCQTEREVVLARSLLPGDAIERIQRDGYCLDQDDLESPHVIEGVRFLDMEQLAAMAELGIDSEDDYRRAYQAIEAAVKANAARGGQASIVIKKKGRTVLDAT